MAIKLGNDFFLWFRFVVQALKLFIGIFGDNGTKTELDKNHIDG